MNKKAKASKATKSTKHVADFRMNTSTRPATVLDKLTGIVDGFGSVIGADIAATAHDAKARLDYCEQVVAEVKALKIPPAELKAFCANSKDSPEKRGEVAAAYFEAVMAGLGHASEEEWKLDENYTAQWNTSTNYFSRVFGIINGKLDGMPQGSDRKYLAGNLKLGTTTAKGKHKRAGKVKEVNATIAVNDAIEMLAAWIADFGAIGEVEKLADMLDDCLDVAKKQMVRLNKKSGK